MCGLRRSPLHPPPLAYTGISPGTPRSGVTCRGAQVSPGARMKQMHQKQKASQPSSKTLPKASTGIQGLDEITGGGLPRGRPTLVSGGAGAGKTLFGLEFLVRGATHYNEPGLFMSFEESIPDLTKNVASLGFDLDRLVADKKLFVDHVSITRSELGAIC